MASMDISQDGAAGGASTDRGAAKRTDWDAIVVGSGLGGLSTAAYLATNGMRTLVLEQHDIVGGCSQVFRRKNRYEFDAGVHYLGDCQPGGVIPTVLRGVGLEDRIEFLPMDPDGHDTLRFPDFTFRMPVGWDNYLRRLVELFPDEREQLTRCVGELRCVAEMFKRVYAPSAEHAVLDVLRRPRSLARFGRAGYLTLARFLEHYRLGEQARAVLGAPLYYTGVTPATTPAVTLALLLWHYLESGGWYPHGGGQVLAANLTEVLRAHGGGVRTKARAEKILVSEGRVRGVRLSTGEVFHAPVVVSGADVKRTYLDLIGAEHLRAATVKRAATWRMAASMFNVYLAFDVDLTKYLRNSNYWLIPGYDSEAQANPVDTARTGEAELDPLELVAASEDLQLYITSTSVKDPHGQTLDHGGHSTMEVLLAFPDDKALWGLSGAAGERYQDTPRYQRVKQAITDRVVQAVTRAFPELEGHIVWRESSTPVSHERYTLATGGNWGGVALSPGQLLHRPRAKTEIPGLFLTGGSTLYGPGIVGTLRGGVATAGAILGRNLWKQIQAGEIFGDPTRLAPIEPGWDLDRPDFLGDLTICLMLPGAA